MTKLLHIGLVSGALLLSACSDSFVNTAAYGIFPQQESNLTEQNYAVADYLVSGARNYIERRDLIIVQPLVDVEQPGMASEISKAIPEEVGVRMSQLGYRMDLSPVALADTNYRKPVMSTSEKPDFILSGTFKRRRIEMDVNMRITEVGTGRVISAFDYVMPLNREIADMAEPQPKIMRVQ